ncbi:MULTISPECIES: cytochrome P450 [Mycolicibacterium]|uniref:Steroid C26-monooxygenase n=1 Tax=Mycolicibacterium phocaicum TaxID=319706 RepID=A0A7I7ZSY0_9MYCO|nr:MULTISPECIES: cytochrome P450 [Mycolicibacterium]SHV07661.1 cytochrome P450 [Mycobacteroides abscessus subsp. abscessus]RUP29477.1 MAG: cytochrome P450 [Mycolicibacterium sp.]TLH73719.1 cytochrome P450 [Mycolicibacterium phocaicum]UCZ61303.1 cytochrome P450 [Mycolicibacterium phocaicum]BBZ55871.1 linalool 8-monooxygenase [Mycolicibacterium phocaicum]
MTTESFTDIDLATVDLTDLTYFQDGPPHEIFARMRTAPGPHWNALTDADEPGFWSFTKFDDIQTISSNPELFSSARGGVFFTATMGAAPVEVLREVILGMDPPRHTHQRGVVQAVFTPRMIRQMEDGVRATVTTLIDSVIERGTCDFVDEIAVELPLIVIADMLGVAQDERRQLFAWTNQLSHAAATGNTQQGLAALMEIGGYLTGLTAERKANPGDDLLSRMLLAEVDGQRLSEAEITFFFGILMFAGNDTTRNTASGGLRALIENPAERQKLIDDPELIPGAVEEMLRWVSPVSYFTRTVTADTVVGGHALKEGERVCMWYGAGSRDPEKNADPETFNVSRGKPAHQAFGGGGPHFCLGNQLARLELRVLFEELLRRIPDMQITGPVTRLVSSFSNELTSMPVTFTPGSVEH